MRKLAVLCLALGVAVTMLPAGAGASSASPTEHSKALPQLAPAPNDDLTAALRAGEITEAQYALQRARAMFRPVSVRARFGSVARPDPQSATLVLRDLAIRLQDLDAAERTQARALLARPTDGPADQFGDGYTVPEAAPLCGPHVCIHYVTSTIDAAASDYVSLALSVYENDVWANQIDNPVYGYRAPKSDLLSPNNGGSALVDVYLADIGDDGLYGYCTSDDPNLDDPSYLFFDMSAYCVIDNDFSQEQFGFGGGAFGTEALQVTAAHEFFHAVQFAYDIAEDIWIMESTAVWMEDEIFDDVNDNYQYLFESALTAPRNPLDDGDRGFFFLYGNWIFWRFVSEAFGPEVVGDVWDRASGAAGDLNEYSIQATKNVLNQTSSFGDILAMFTAENYVAELVYEEGAEYRAEVGPPSAAKSFTLKKKGSTTGTKEPSVDHLSGYPVVFKPGSNVKSGAKLKINVDAPSKAVPRAQVLIFKSNDVVTENSISLNSGSGGKKVGFGKGNVTKVVLFLVNASTRYEGCFSGQTPFSCGGAFPKDDNAKFTYKATVK